MPNHPDNAVVEAKTGLLLSGGLDSGILLGCMLAEGKTVAPLYIDSHMAWQADELASLRRYLAALQGSHPGLGELVVLDLPVADLYGDHWSFTGRGVPDAASADDAVYLPGRNVLLLTKAALWCQLRGIERLAIGVLSGNPFSDATERFFTAFQTALETALGRPLVLLRPLADRSKADVLRLGVGLPLEHTFSCIAPQAGLHCGRCNKCAERQAAFRDAGVADPTRYHASRGMVRA